MAWCQTPQTLWRHQSLLLWSHTTRQVSLPANQLTKLYVCTKVSRCPRYISNISKALQPTPSHFILPISSHLISSRRWVLFLFICVYCFYPLHQVNYLWYLLSSNICSREALRTRAKTQRNAGLKREKWRASMLQCGSVTLPSRRTFPEVLPSFRFFSLDTIVCQFHRSSSHLPLPPSSFHIIIFYRKIFYKRVE